MAQPRLSEEIMSKIHNILSINVPNSRLHKSSYEKVFWKLDCNDERHVGLKTVEYVCSRGVRTLSCLVCNKCRRNNISPDEYNYLWPALDNDPVVKYYAVQCYVDRTWPGAVVAYLPPPLNVVIQHDSVKKLSGKCYGSTIDQARQQRAQCDRVLQERGFHVLRVYGGDNETIPELLAEKLPIFHASTSSAVFRSATYPQNL